MANAKPTPNPKPAPTPPAPPASPQQQPEGAAPVADDALVTAILANDDFVAGVKAIIDGHLDANLGELVQAAMPAAPESETAPAPDASEKKPSPTRASTERRQQDDARKAKIIAEQRSKAKLEARALHDNLKRARGKGEPLDLGDFSAAMLLLDNGSTLSIDYQRPIDMSDVVANADGSVTLKHPAIDLGGFPEPFVVRGLTLALVANDDPAGSRRSLRSVLGGPVTVSAGARAKITANSLVFRDR